MTTPPTSEAAPTMEEITDLIWEGIQNRMDCDTTSRDWAEGAYEEIKPLFNHARAQGFREGVEAAYAALPVDCTVLGTTVAQQRVRALLLTDAPDELAALRAENTRLREALKEGEIKFEAIRRLLIKELEEPERSAFWNAVAGRNFTRAALAPKEG